MRVSGHRISISNIAGATISKRRFWQKIAVLTASGAIGAWLPLLKPTRYITGRITTTDFHRAGRRGSRHCDSSGFAGQGQEGRGAGKEASVKPQGPLIIAISIQKQRA